MISDIDKIFIDNGDTKEYLEKNENGFFEKEIVIKSKHGDKIGIGESDGFLSSYYYYYNVV